MEALEAFTSSASFLSGGSDDSDDRKVIGHAASQHSGFEANEIFYAKWQYNLDNMAVHWYDTQMAHNLVTTDAKRGKWTAPGSNGGNMLGIAAKGTGDMIERIGSGFSFNALLRFQKTSRLPMAAIADVLQIPPRTMARRRADGRLHPQESERLLRLAALFEKAVDLFEGDVEGACTWFIRPVRALGHEQPIVYAQTELGAREVEHLIGRLEHGVFS